MVEKTPGYASIHRSSLDPRVRLASTLRFLAGGAWQDCARLHGQKKATFYIHFRETLDAIMACEEIDVDWTDRDELSALEEECSLGGAGKGKFRGIIGYLDGVVFRCRRPWVGELPKLTDLYCGRKKFWGISAQAACTSGLRFTFFAVVAGSNAHDSTAFRLTELGKLTQKPASEGGLPTPFFFVADAAYAGHKHVVTPFAGVHAIGSEEDTFNYVQSSKRMAIERAFGVLVRRWGILWRKLEFDFKLNCKILQVASWQ